MLCDYPQRMWITEGRLVLEWRRGNWGLSMSTSLGWLRNGSVIKQLSCKQLPYVRGNTSFALICSFSLQNNPLIRYYYLCFTDEYTGTGRSNLWSPKHRSVWCQSLGGELGTYSHKNLTTKDLAVWFNLTHLPKVWLPNRWNNQDCYWEGVRAECSTTRCLMIGRN